MNMKALFDKKMPISNGMFLIFLLFAAGATICAVEIMASDVIYDNSTSGLEAENVQDAIDELDANMDLVPNVPESPFASATLITSDQQTQINEWIGNPFLKWTPCYLKSKDGASSSTFHTKCDNRGPSVTVLKLSNGKLIGAYIDNSWSASYGYRASQQAFIFSLTNGKRYPIGYSFPHAMYAHVSYGPTFGNGHDIYVDSSMNSGYCNFPYAYSYNGVSNSPNATAYNDLCGSYNSWTLSEIEVFILQ